MASVTFKHLRQLGYCAPSVRAWCKANGFNIRDFASGVDSRLLRAIGDHHAIAAAALAEQEDNDGQEKETDGRL